MVDSHIPRQQARDHNDFPTSHTDSQQAQAAEVALTDDHRDDILAGDRHTAKTKEASTSLVEVDRNEREAHNGMRLLAGAMDHTES